MRLTLILLIIFLTAGSIAQQSCCEPPAFSFDELPDAIPLENRGNGKFVTASTVDSVQFYVNQGFNLFHNFNYFEAFTSLTHAAQLDSLCLAAKLGQLLVYEATKEDDSKSYYKLQTDLLNLGYDNYPMSNMELYLFTPEVDVFQIKKKAVDTFINNSYERFLEKNYEDPEAHVWYLRNLGITEKADSFAEIAIKKFPDYSPLIHYSIHLWEQRDAEKVLKFRNQISELAPESGHLTHMPGHVYHYNGLYELADSSFRSSYKVDSLYNAKYPKRAPYNWNIVHNVHFIHANLIEMGRIKESEIWLKKLSKLYNKLNYVLYDSPEMMRFEAEAYAYWRRSEFEKAQNLAIDYKELETDYFPDDYYVEGLAIYFEALQYFQKDFEDSLNITCKKYQNHYKAYLKKGKKEGWKKWNLKGGEAHNRLYILKRQLEFLTKENDDDFSMSEILEELYDEIERYYSKDPSTMGLLWSELASMKYEKVRDYDTAIELLDDALYDKPNSGIINLNLARVLLKSGQKTLSKKHLDKFYEAWKDADTKLIEFEKARIIGLDLEK